MDALTLALHQAAAGRYTRVVLIAHSQGTIITSNALRMLRSNPQSGSLMDIYLEVYNFANCSNQMPGNNELYLENISNKRDLVAWLGALFPFRGFWEDKSGEPMNIGGTFVTEPLYWGHLLNTHYLDHFKKGSYPGSRLHDFRNGQVPLGIALIGNKAIDQ